MDVQPVDERDSSWEDRDPIFRVYLFRGPGPYSVETVDISDADVLEATRWAQDNVAADGMYAIALVAQRSDAAASRGLVWMIGMDANDQPLTPRQARTLDEMAARKGVAVVGPR